MALRRALERYGVAITTIELSGLPVIRELDSMRFSEDGL
jgi:hypothetical protein